MFLKISDETIQRICRPYLSILNQNPITLKEEDVDRSIREAIEVKKNQFSDRPDLFDRAQEAFNRIYKPEKSAWLACNEAFPDGITGTLLTDWANWMQTRMIMQLEEDMRVETVSIPDKEQSHCCYRYALSKVGINPPEGGLTKSALSRILQNRCKPVHQPQSEDLVLFLNGNSMTHLGIYQDGKILSKEGDNTTIAYLRPLEDMSPKYGKRVIYFRPIHLQ
jgi:hypothetical protein